MNPHQEGSENGGWKVGTGQHCVFYSEENRELRFNMEHSEGAFHVCIEPMPAWYSRADFAPLGAVSDLERSRVLENLRAALKRDGHGCVFEDCHGTKIQWPD